MNNVNMDVAGSASRMEKTNVKEADDENQAHHLDQKIMDIEA